MTPPQVKTVTPRKKPKPMRQVSKKRAKVNRLRSKFVKEQLAKFPACQIYITLRLALSSIYQEISDDDGCEIENAVINCQHKSVDVHEILSRARAPGAKTILDPANVLCACRPCHNWVTTHPRLAEELGLLKSSRGL